MADDDVKREDFTAAVWEGNKPPPVGSPPLTYAVQFLEEGERRVETILRWVKCSHRSSDLYAGGIYLGYVEASIDGSWKAWARTGSVPAWFGDFATEAFAKAAVVKTMVDRLTKKETK